MTFCWYVAQTKPNADAAAERRLRKQDFVCHFARLLVRTPWHGQIVDRYEPLLPSYGFVLLDLADPGEKWKRVNSTRAITHLLPSSERPLPIAHSEISALIEAEAEGLFHKGAVSPGDRLKVFRGQLVNQILECVDSADGRVSALWSCFGQKIKVSLPIDDVTVYG